MIILNEFEDFGTEKSVKSLDPKPIKIKKAKQPIPLRKKRLIAQMVAGISIAGMIAFASSSMVYAIKSDSARFAKLDMQNEKYDTLNTFQYSEEFKNVFTSSVNQATELYKNGEIEFDEYMSRINYLDSYEFIESVVHKSTNEAIKSKINNFNSQMMDLEHSKEENEKKCLGFLSGSLASGAMLITPACKLSYSLSKEKIEKEESLQK